MKFKSVISYPNILIDHQFFYSSDDKQKTIVRVIPNIATFKPSILVVGIYCFLHIVSVSDHVGH